MLRLITLLLVTAGCQFDVTSKGTNFGSTISGIATPFLGSIVKSEYSFLSDSYAAVCSDPVYARLYEIESDGSITDGNWISTQTLTTNARYTFNLKELGLDHKNTSNVKFLVKVEGCNGEVFKRPVTDFDDKQDVDYKTTVVADIVNVDGSAIDRSLVEVPRTEVKRLINNVSGSNFRSALDSLTNNASTANLFTTIFGAPPTIILDSKPEVILSSPTTNLNELAVNPFSVQTFHPDPDYSFAYRWKLDGTVKSSSSTWNYIPGRNSQGQHQVEVFVGKNDGSNNIDTSKPYYYKTFYITVDNNILPVAPAISLNASNPSPTTSDTIDVDIITGAAQSNCESFSEISISESSTPPGPLTYTWACSTSGTQTETISVTNTDGPKRIYLWVRDSAGNVGLPTYVDVILDATAPIVSLTSPAISRGGETKTLTYSITDATTTPTASLYYANDGSTFNLVKTLNPGLTSTTHTLPLDNTTNAKFRIIASDSAGNTTQVDTSAFTVDSTAPLAPSVSLHSSLYTQTSAVTLSAASCPDSYVLINEGTQPLLSDSGWQSCNTTAGAITYTISNGVQGLHNLKAWAKDAAGNVSATATTVQTYYDTAAPVMSFSSLPVNVKGSTAQTVSLLLTELHASNTQSISYELFNGTSWSAAGTLSVTNGPLSNSTFSKSITMPAWNTNAASVRATYTDLSGRQSTITSGAFIIDSSGPTASSITINNGVPITGNRNVLLTFSALDSLNNITAFCPKYNDLVVPLDADSCWVTLASISETPAPSISISNYPFQLGSLQGDYNITIWYKDSHGNISNLSNSGSGSAGTDLYTMTFTPDPPPSISNLITSSTDAPSNPLTTSDTTVPFGFDVYIRWNITDNLAIPNGNVSLSYTTNDSTYTTIASGLNNGVNGDCTLSTGTSGCYKWTASSPTNTYFRVKLVVSDSSGTPIFDVSNPVNTGSVKFLSGNTSLGVGGAAVNAILIGANEHQYNDNHDAQSFVVSKKGYVFFKFNNRGIVYISPEDGILRDLIPTTGTASGDGGNVTSATLRSPVRMILDYNDNILIWDYNKVRKIDINSTPWTITTLFGGGADGSDGAPALSASLSTSYSDQLTATPNGRIYFNKSNEIWYYDSSDQLVKKHIALTGFGTDDMATWKASFDNVACPGINAAFSFNKSTSAITKIMRRMSSTTAAACGSQASTYALYNTNFDLSSGVATAPHPPQTTWSSFKFTGLDGNLYVLAQGRGTLTKYNPTTNTFQTVLGVNSSQNGRCADGTAATSCKAVIMSAFVNEFGKIYFFDLGVLRMVDSSGLVQTIAGQPRNFGIGYNPISARYSQINFFEVNGNDIYVRNELENQIVKFSLTGGNLVHVAGNTSKGTATMSTDARTTSLPNCGWSVPCGFVIDSANNRLYHNSNSGGYVSYIDLNTNQWVLQSTGFQDSVARVSFVGINADGLLAYLPSHYGASGNKVTLRMYNQSASTSQIIYGQDAVLTSLSSTICTGTTGTSCTFPHTMDQSVQERFRFDSSTGKWLITIRNSNTLYSIPSLGGTVSIFESMANGFIAYDFWKSGTDDFVFYCSTSGNLYKRNVATNVETQLTLPISSMKCDSGSLYYHAGRNSLIFAYKQNGLFGVAEYLSP